MYKVLIVDDEQFIRRGLGSCMDWQVWGCELIGAAASGEEAMELVAKNRPDIVISDIHMEKMSGLELVEQLSFQYPEIKTILFTGIYEFNHVYNAIKFDVVDLILKPTSPGRIQQALTKAIHQIETEQAAGNMRALIKRQSVQNQRLKQAMLISNLAENGDYGTDSIAALASVGLKLHHYAMITLLLHGARQEEDAAVSLREAKHTITGYIDMIFEDCAYYCLFTGLHSFHILLDFEQVTAHTPMEIREYCVELSKTIDNLTEYYSMIGISALHTDPAELHCAKDESVNASNYAAYDRDTASIVEFSHMPCLSGDTISGLRPYLDKLSDAIEGRRDGMAQEILGEIFEYFSAHKIPFEEVRSTGVLIADLCMRHLWNFNCKDRAEGEVFSVRHRYYRNLLQCIHIVELTECLRKIVELTVRNLSATSGSTRSLIDRVEYDIRRNYQEELSLEKIAARYHISPGYLSRLFKSKKDVSLMTYVQNVRIERAKELIDSTDLRTYEIAAVVGIPDPVYFSKTFKKATGMRVRDYRSRSQEGAEKDSAEKDAKEKT